MIYVRIRKLDIIIDIFDLVLFFDVMKILSNIVGDNNF